MKQNYLTKIFVAIIAMLTMTTTAVAQNAQMLSFGFFQSDNASLSKDYVATVPAVVAGTTTYSFEVALPAGTNLTALVARFTVAEGNSVTVDGVAQTSGVTKNDFTDPVDYLVRGANNVRYTVTVVEGAASSKVWTEVSVLDPITLTGIEGVTGAYSGAVMKINPKDNLPYVVFGVRGADNKLTVAKFDGAAWNAVGAPSFTPKVSGSHYNFDIALDGTPYVIFNDQEAVNKAGISVMKFDNSAWVNIGVAGITATTAQYVGIAALEKGVFAVQQNNKAGDFAKRTIVASYWNGSSWATEAAFSGLYGYCAIASNGKEAYVMGAGASTPWGYSVLNTNGADAKAQIADNYVPGGGETAASTSTLTGCSLTIGPDGTLYMLAPDTGTGVLKMRLSAYKDGAFTTVGGNIPPINYSAAGFARQMLVRAAIAKDGTPYIIYNDNNESNNIYMTYYDTEKGWIGPSKIWDAPEATAGDLNFVFDADGVGYASFTDKANKIHLLKYAEVDPASVKSVKTAKTSGRIFNMQGMQVDKAGKGIYIIDGKKVMQ